MPRRLPTTGKAEEQRAFELALRSLVVTVNDHDTYTGGHSYRVADIATNIARLMGLAPSEVARVREAGLVHDIGKIAIPDRILSKKEPLTDEEFHLIRLHPILGASILSRQPGMENVIPIVLHHHERWDGKGYPSRLAGVDIPLYSRIIFVADAFDAMTTERPYGRVQSTADALTELRACSGKQFDPVCVDAIHEAHRLGLLDEAASAPAYDAGSVVL